MSSMQHSPMCQHVGKTCVRAGFKLASSFHLEALIGTAVTFELQQPVCNDKLKSGHVCQSSGILAGVLWST
jgi:hypothetical protein